MSKRKVGAKHRLGLYDSVPFFSGALKGTVITINNILSFLKLTSQEVIWLVGDGRSGTTWLANIINHQQRYRFMFEPFHPILEPRSWFQPFQYLRPGDDEGQILSNAEKVFSGRFQHQRVDQFTAIGLQKGILIKDIFTHLMMGWTKARFPHVKHVLMLRHPCAVATSKVKLSDYAVWVSDVDRLLVQDDLVRDFLQPFRSEIANYTQTRFERFVVIWCITHYVPLCQLGKDDLHLVFYEELCVNPEEEMRRLLAFLEQDPGESLAPGLVAQFGIPSQTCRQDSAVHTGENLISWWQSELTKSQIRKADEILKMFGLDRIYLVDRLMPDRQAAERFSDSCQGKWIND